MKALPCLWPSVYPAVLVLGICVRACVSGILAQLLVLVEPANGKAADVSFSLGPPRTSDAPAWAPVAGQEKFLSPRAAGDGIHLKHPLSARISELCVLISRYTPAYLPLQRTSVYLLKSLHRSIVVSFPRPLCLMLCLFYVCNGFYQHV